MPSECSRLAQTLNRDCQCVSVDRDRLRRALALGEAGADMVRLIDEERPHLFAASTVFLGQASVERMAEIVAAVERVAALPAWAEQVLAWAPETASHRCGAGGRWARL